MIGLNKLFYENFQINKKVFKNFLYLPKKEVPKIDEKPIT